MRLTVLCPGCLGLLPNPRPLSPPPAPTCWLLARCGPGLVLRGPILAQPLAPDCLPDADRTWSDVGRCDAVTQSGGRHRCCTRNRTGRRSLRLRIQTCVYTCVLTMYIGIHMEQEQRPACRHARGHAYAGLRIQACTPDCLLPSHCRRVFPFVRSFMTSSTTEKLATCRHASSRAAARAAVCIRGRPPVQSDAVHIYRSKC